MHVDLYGHSPLELFSVGVIFGALIFGGKLVWLLLILLLFAALVAGLKVLEKRSGEMEGEGYVLRNSILTPAERSFLGVLESLSIPGIRICVKVRLADIFDARDGKKGFQGRFNRIAAKHVDFLLVRQDSGAPLLGIELDDKSHARKDRKRRDQFLDHAFRSAGLPLVRIPAGPAYQPRAISEQVNEALQRARN